MSGALIYVDPPGVPLVRALWSLLDGMWDVSKGSWGPLYRPQIVGLLLEGHPKKGLPMCTNSTYHRHRLFEAVACNHELSTPQQSQQCNEVLARRRRVS